VGMPDVRHFTRELRWLGVASLIWASAQVAILGVALVRNRSDMVEEPGQIAQDVTKLGGPCLAVKELEYGKYGPLGIGDCKVHYTNVDQTAATVTFQFVRGMSWVIVTADAVTDGGPLASLNWRVTRSTEALRYDPGVT
jgi:hypothetical protein